MRKKIIIAIIALFVVALAVAPCAVSYAKFGTANPFSASSGLIRVTKTNAQSVKISDDPIIIIAEPDESLLPRFMESKGFEQVEEDRPGSVYAFSNGTETVHIAYSQNKYYSLWKWQD